jgi:CheY-like chemotaxis protein
MPPLAILVVEDDDAVSRLLTLALRGFGYSVHLASSGMQAVGIFRREAIDIVLMDVQMPDMDGPETLTALRTIDPSVVCCFMTGHPGDYTTEELLRLGSAGVLEKPFGLEDLRQFLLRSVQNEKSDRAPARDRRAFPRLPANTDFKVACFLGCLDYGQNLAMGLLDFSESGLRVALKRPLDIGEEVFLSLDGPCLSRPMICGGTVVWIDKEREEDYAAGVSLDRYLAYLDARRVT